MSCWDQFVTMLFCHLAKAKSLREIIGGMASQESFLYHLGVKLMKRSSLAYANPAALGKSIGTCSINFPLNVGLFTGWLAVLHLPLE